MSARRKLEDVHELVRTLKRETKRLEFKREFAPSAPGAWCEILKDMAAIANSGGGHIVFGVDNAGKATGWDPSELLALDLADVVDKLSRYVGEQYDEFELQEAKKGSKRVAVMTIRPRLTSPLVFEKPGTYQDPESPKAQRTAFPKGSIYFRHGAKSEPASAADVATFINRELARIRRDWLRDVGKISKSPGKYFVVPVSTMPSISESGSTKVRVVDDPTAPAIARTDFDSTHPHRQTELIDQVNKRLGKKVVSSYDIQCVRRTHRTDANKKFFHRPKFGTPQYSDAFVAWLIAEYKKNSQFFVQARQNPSRQAQNSKADQVRRGIET